ncbi:MAG: DUF2851 family protein [Flavobacteriia bacterium]|nr:DUF2851 family protein [Flavobacteriia bacterium]
MKEEYLHYIWRLKKIPIHQLKLSTGEEIIIHYCGDYNQNQSGPDFNNAIIEWKGIKWVGNLEMHINSSDWYQHKHHYDYAYDNVILHVVYKHDKEVFIKNRSLPTIEIKEFVNELNYQDFLNFTSCLNDFQCQGSIEKIDSIFIESMKEKALVKRLNRKLNQFKNLSFENDPAQLLYNLMGKAFGCKVNAQPFQELTNQIPIRILKKETASFSKEIILNASGAFGDLQLNQGNWIYFQQKHKISGVPRYNWKYKGLRPSSFPEKRLMQFASIVEKFDFDTSFTYLTVTEIKNYLVDLLELEPSLPKITKTMKELILINCFVPFIWWYGNVKMDDELQQKAIDLLIMLPAETNTILKKWKKNNVKCLTSYDSQALLEIYNEFCVCKKCLHCDIGINILNK